MEQVDSSSQTGNPLLKWIVFYLLIGVVGVGSGFSAIIFRNLIGFFHNLFFYGQFSWHYNALMHALPSYWGAGIIVIPVLGALGASFLVKTFAEEARGSGVPEVMDAIYYCRGIIRPVVAVVKAFASSITIGSGGSAGREGPIIQIGASFGSALGQWVKVHDWQRIVLIASGAGGGIAATFNAPFGGVLFAMEIMLPEISARTIIPVSIATAVGTYTSYFYFGNSPFFPLTVNAFPVINGITAGCYILLSLLVGLLATIFIRSIYFTEDLVNRIPLSYPLRHMLSMLFVGISIYLMMRLFGHYYVEGAGYASIMDVLRGLLDKPGLLFLLASLKLVDTAITLGSGGSGGVFSPLLFIGATFGAAFIYLCLFFFPDSQLNIQFVILAGMAGIVGAGTGAPVTAIIMTAELTKDFSFTLPLMIVVALSYAVRRFFLKESVYTLKLKRRNHFIPDALYTKKDLMR